MTSQLPLIRERDDAMPAPQPTQAERAREPHRRTKARQGRAPQGCCKQPHVGDIDPAMHPCARVPDLAALIGPDEVRYLSHFLTWQPLGWPTVECSRFN